MTTGSKFALGFGGSVAAAIASATLYYTASLPTFAVAIGLFVPPLLVALFIWQSAWSRVFGFILLAAVSYSVAMMVAVFIFHDAP